MSSTIHSGPDSGIYALDPLQDPRWSEFIKKHPRASVFHSVGWLRALQDCYGYEPIAYTSSPHGAPLSNGILFCRVQSWITGRRLVSLPFSDHCEPLVESQGVLQQLLTSAKEAVLLGKYRYIELRPRSVPLTEGMPGIPEEYILQTLDLQPTLEDLYRRLHFSSIRRKIQRAERENLILEAGCSERLLSEFYRLHLMTRKRQGLPAQPKAWFQKVMEHLPATATIRVAKKGETVLAAILTLESPRTLVYKYGCSDARYHNLGSMPFLFWNMILDAKQRGFTEVDLGRSKVSHTSLITFKERLGAKRKRLIYTRFPIRKSIVPPLETALLRTAGYIFSHCPNRVLIAAGTLLYPHIG
jgi:CelD/BcsL family acetyltransferase involved in cellulose biosynthesis